MKTDRQVRHPFLDLWVNALCLLMLAGYVRRHASEGCSYLQCILAVTPLHAPSLILHVTSKECEPFRGITGQHSEEGDHYWEKGLFLPNLISVC